MIDLKYLKLIQAINRQGSMTNAAEQLHLTQPALSHQLKKLEEELGATVFERNGRRLELTPVGDRLLEAAGRVLDEMNRTAEDVQRLASGKAGTLRFTTECYTCYHWMPAVLNDYQKRFPDVDVRVIAEAAQNPKAYLEENKIDAAIVTRSDAFGSDYHVTPLMHDEFICLMHQNHPWAHRSYVEGEDFETEHLISVKDFSDEGSDVYTKLFRSTGVTPEKLTTIPIATEAIIEMVKANMGVTIMTSWVANSYLERFKELTGCRLTTQGMHRHWHFAYPKKRDAYYIRAFAEQVKAAFE